VLCGVVGEAHHCLGEPLAVGQDRDRRAGVEAPVAPRQTTGLGEKLFAEAAQAEPLELEEVAASARFGRLRALRGSGFRSFRFGSSRSPPSRTGATGGGSS
jgi:hypothetical protein